MNKLTHKGKNEYFNRPTPYMNSDLDLPYDLNKNPVEVQDFMGYYDNPYKGNFVGLRKNDFVSLPFETKQKPASNIFFYIFL